jgi:hypothetical protein
LETAPTESRRYWDSVHVSDELDDVEAAENAFEAVEIDNPLELSGLGVRCAGILER